MTNQTQTLRVGDKAPDFTLLNQDKEPVSLSGLAGEKILLVFIPFPFTGVCDGEACELRDNLAELESQDARLLVITCDTRPANKAWSDQNGFTFPILSDFWPHGEVTKAYGCFNEATGAASRTSLVIDGEGVIRQIVATAGEARDFSLYPQALSAIS